MGDLDDFFAKKDKKGKTKTKIVAASLYDDMKKESEAKKEKLKKKKELQSIEQAPAVLKKTKEDDDWEDFDDPSDLNLEGLKVVNLAERQQGRPDGGGSGGGGTTGDGESGGDGGGSGEGADDGPWRRKAAADSAAADATAAAAAVSSAAAVAASAAANSDAGATSASTGAADEDAGGGGPVRARYEPPHKRSAAAAVTGGVGRPSADLFQARPLPRGVAGGGRRDRNAPNINDVEQFPTLATGPSAGGGGADDDCDARRAKPDTRPFESVRDQGGRYGRSHVAGGGGTAGSAKPEAVSVSNRWTALGEDTTT